MLDNLRFRDLIKIWHCEVFWNYDNTLCITNKYWGNVWIYLGYYLGYYLKFHRILALKIFQETDYLPAVVGTRRAADEIK